MNLDLLYIQIGRGAKGFGFWITTCTRLLPNFSNFFQSVLSRNLKQIAIMFAN